MERGAQHKLIQVSWILSSSYFKGPLLIAVFPRLSVETSWESNRCEQRIEMMMEVGFTLETKWQIV